MILWTIPTYVVGEEHATSAEAEAQGAITQSRLDCLWTAVILRRAGLIIILSSISSLLGEAVREFNRALACSRIAAGGQAELLPLAASSSSASASSVLSLTVPVLLEKRLTVKES